MWNFIHLADETLRKTKNCVQELKHLISEIFFFPTRELPRSLLKEF